MPRLRRRILSLGSSHSDSHTEKPWVYFMVDCFFLITQFFLMSFQFKTEHLQLVRSIPPGGTKPVDPPIHSSDEALPVHAYQENGATVYLFQGKPASFNELAAALGRLNSTGKTYSVRLSYTGEVPYQSVISVMNECSRNNIGNCSFVPLRADQARQ